jgi:GNAT superfamily N-acetyltransferase
MAIEFPLTRANRIRLARAFLHVPRVDLAIECAVEGQMGRAFVDDVQQPSAYAVRVGPFLYLAGDAAGPGGRALLELIAPHVLLMPSAPGWLEVAREAHGERLACFERTGFASAQLSTAHLDRLCRESEWQAVRQMDLPFAARLWGRDHFVDLSDFDSAGDFVQRGIGYYLEKDGDIVGAAFSSLVCSRGIEVSLFVAPGFRRQGLGTALASRLVLWCLENGADAHWDAANPESCRLATRLGYVQTCTYEAYYLKSVEREPDRV